MFVACDPWGQKKLLIYFCFCTFVFLNSAVVAEAVAVDPVGREEAAIPEANLEAVDAPQGEAVQDVPHDDQPVDMSGMARNEAAGRCPSTHTRTFHCYSNQLSLTHMSPTHQHSTDTCQLKTRMSKLFITTQ